MQQNANVAAASIQNTVKGIVPGGYGASSTGSSLSADAYRQRHEITVHVSFVISSVQCSGMDIFLKKSFT